MYVPPELVSSESWEGEFPPERALIAWLASVSATEAAVLLRQMLDGALEEFDAAPDPKFLRSRQAFVPGAVIQSRDEDDWEFPGGGWLEEALMAIEASEEIHRVATKSVSHVLAAAQAIVSAVIELRDYLRDPADWRRYRAEFLAAEDNPRAMVELGSRETARLERKQRDALAVWTALLRRVLTRR